MKAAAFAALAAGLVMAAAISSAGTPKRNETRSFKGMELHSWKPEGEDWHFSLLPGTNRVKPESERTDPKVTIKGIAAVKSRLATLAKGDVVFWGWPEGQAPPAEITDEIGRYCRELEIRLVRQGPVGTGLEARPTSSRPS